MSSNKYLSLPVFILPTIFAGIAAFTNGPFSSWNPLAGLVALIAFYVAGVWMWLYL